MKLRVEVVRIGYATKAIEVEAISNEDDQATALDVASNESFQRTRQRIGACGRRR